MITVKKWTAFSLFILIIATSCRKKDLTDPNIKTPTAKYDVWVVNEGSFGSGLGNITAYNSPDGDLLTNPVEEANGTALGDVAQSAYVVGDEIWVVINNSNKILILDPYTFKIKDNINNIKTPKFACVFGDFFYVGSLFSDEFYQIGIDSRDVQTYHASASGVTDVQELSGKIYMAVSDSSNSHLYYFDPNTSNIEDVADLGTRAPIDIEAIGDELWVLSGNSWLGIDYSLSSMAADGKIRNYVLPPGEYKSIEAYGGALYILANSYVSTNPINGIYEVNTNQTTGIVGLDPKVGMPSGVSTFYSFGIDPSTGNFYASDAKSYTINGDAYVFDPVGRALTKFEVGIVPGFFMFR